MAIADKTVTIDGQTYYAGDTLPDLGSIMATDVQGNKRSYFGFIADRAKLPVYDNLAHGSDATLVDPNGVDATVILYFHAPTKAWYQL